MSFIKIYPDTSVCAWHLNNLNFSYTKTDLDHCDLAVFHFPYPYVGQEKTQFEIRIDLALKTNKKVIVLISELHDETLEFCLNFLNPNIRYFTCGLINNVPTTPWMDWFITSTELYQKTNILDELEPFKVKEKSFDILLGQPKPHRSYIHDYINNNHLNDQVIMTYMDWKGSPILKMSDKEWIWESDIEELSEDTRWTVSLVKYRGHEIRLSQIVPISVYNKTAYSLIAETNTNNQYSFYTEKTVKPILGQRLFLTLSGQYFLRNLRNLGFKTFDGIIDEGYDAIEDSNLRYQLVCQQLEYLIDQPQQIILNQIKPIVEHNKNLMLNYDWHKEFQKEFKQALIL